MIIFGLIWFGLLGFMDEVDVISFFFFFSDQVIWIQNWMKNNCKEVIKVYTF